MTISSSTMLTMELEGFYVRILPSVHIYDKDVSCDILIHGFLMLLFSAMPTGEALYAEDFIKVLERMHLLKRYKKMVCINNSSHFIIIFLVFFYMQFCS